MTERRVTPTLLLAVVLLGGCSLFGPASSTDVAGRRSQAAALLARWTAALPTANGSPAFVPIGELTGQVCDWELAVGDNNKVALMAGAIEAAVTLPAQTPANATVRWDDGTSWTAPTISAAQALAAIQGGHGAPTCPGCVSLRVTGAQLSTARIETSHGMASAPAWEFAIAGTAVRVTRIAVAPAAIVAIDPGSLGSSGGWVGPSIQSATAQAAGLALTVTFVGAPDPGDKPCGADYSAEAAESSTAVAVFVIEHQN
ncbi:MAG: hypothetical protein ACRDGI_07795, partial [Candidatus Limnocylindrales bacterium]